jgi:hypothetical protein
MASGAINSRVDLIGRHPVEVRREDVKVFSIPEAIGQLKIVQRDSPVHELQRFHASSVSMKRRSERWSVPRARRCRRSTMRQSLPDHKRTRASEP